MRALSYPTCAQPPAPASEAPTATKRAFWLAYGTATVVVAGLAARVLGSLGDLWLDEIWTVSAVAPLTSLAEVAGLNSSNNHHLTSLLCFLIGNTDHWLLYRLPSVLAGSLAIAVVWMIARREGRLEASVAAALTAGSYLMIYYSSEVRGYALVVLFALATFYALLRYRAEPRWRWAIAVWAAMALGLFSQAMFVFVYLAAIVWLAFPETRDRQRWRDVTLDALRCLAVPVICFGLFYVFILTRLELGGADPYDLADVLVQTLSYAGGGGATMGPITFAAAGATAACFVCSLFHLWRKRRRGWLFIVVLTVAPAIILIVQRPPVLFVRYFLISIVFGYLASAYFLADLYRQSPKAALAVAVLLSAFLLGNGVQAFRLIRYGRGGYLQAMRYMERRTPGTLLSITADHAFRNRILVEYYRHFLPAGRQVTFVANLDPKSPAPDWFIVHRADEPYQIAPTLCDPYGRLFDFRELFPHAGPSGWDWILYSTADVTR